MMNKRETKITRDYLKFPDGSVLIETGDTKVICTAIIQNGVPPFLKDVEPKQGWLTAEYNMIPGAPNSRFRRERNGVKGRTAEIQRLIGRSLRAVIDMTKFPGYQLIIDCDVIQADGGTRTAAVNGAFIALCSTINKMMANREFVTFPILDFIAAISVGIINNELMLDLCYEEDSSAEIDMNLVMTGRGRIIEVQATAEKLPVERSEFDKLMEVGFKGIKEIIELEKNIVGKNIK
ncbi:ribonuclease PH [candidate division WOR-3 bacterium]|nr:ribonuclease PH [candidate division WOR-3 bacterium]